MVIHVLISEDTIHSVFMHVDEERETMELHIAVSDEPSSVRKRT